MSVRRAAVLREMGLAPLWRLRSVDDVGCDDESPDLANVESAAPSFSAEDASARIGSTLDGRGARAVFPGGVPAAAPRPTPRAGTGIASGAERISRFISDAPVPSPEVTSDAVVGSSARAERISKLDWEALEADIGACTACRLCERRKQAVPGVGDRQADWMLVGEGPGAEEDQRGEPFVGAAGRLLDAMLAAIGLARGENVYIANAVKCRPPHNRTPEGDEISTCSPYLARQIELVRPRLLVALGRPAALALLDAEVSIGASRGKIFHRGETPVVVTYHPAYLLRNQADKAKVWEDLCFARRLMRDLGSADR
ncbi:MAG: uracil-DNA glycosylase [Aromatoleum sp.]|uniref:uracil-DNA glycosylase n=1 Tax=Aromatoleum sp. TaxID=2307007 RepID=UPI002893FD7C|nr:uracil-DNA glycosylase [Aromatoleum sp.]MDT3671070.1 uracil-DNA glycosylase [Aromatoleum sp.]